MPQALMQKVLIAGLKDHKKSILEKLQENGIIELAPSPERSRGVEGLTPSEAPSAERSRGEEDFELPFAELKSAISFLESHANKKKSFIETFAPDKEKVGEAAVRSLFYGFDWQSIVKKTEEIENQFANLNNLRSKLKQDIDLLQPWKETAFNLNWQDKLSRVSMLFGKIKTKEASKFIEEINSAVPFCEIELASQKQNESYVIVYYPASLEENISGFILKSSFVKISLPKNLLTVREEIEQMENALYSAAEDRAKHIKELLSLCKYLPKLYQIYDFLSLNAQKKDASSQFADTKYAALLSGWIRQKDMQKLKNIIKNISKEAEVVPVAPHEGEKTPTALENPKVFKPFEVITRIFGVPSSSEVDPTQALSFFYLLFFAICLSDAAYGIILALFSYYLMKKLTLSEGGKNLLQLLFWGGILSVFTGILTGSYFAIDIGSLPKSGIKSFILLLKVIDPIKQPLNMLIISLFLGVIQNIYGLAVGMYWKIKHKDYLAGIFDYGLWIFFLLALVFLLCANAIAPHFIGLASQLSIAGAIFLVLTQGRNESNIFKKAIFGILSLYRTTAFLGDTLSYSRLLALMMTTGIIGMVINIIALLTKDSIPILGYVIMLTVLIIGHTFNLVVSVLGAFVHSMRLQLVEFFGKFYEGAGREFKPFKRETKYIIIR